MFGRTKSSGLEHIPEDTQMIIHDLKKRYKIKNYKTKSGGQSGDGHTMTRIRCPDDTLTILGHWDVHNELLQGGLQAAYSRHNRSTYLYSCESRRILRIQNGRTVEDYVYGGSLARMQDFMEYIKQDSWNENIY